MREDFTMRLWFQLPMPVHIQLDSIKSSDWFDRHYRTRPADPRISSSWVTTLISVVGICEQDCYALVMRNPASSNRTSPVVLAASTPRNHAAVATSSGEMTSASAACAL